MLNTYFFEKFQTYQSYIELANNIVYSTSFSALKFRAWTSNYCLSFQELRNRVNFHSGPRYKIRRSFKIFPGEPKFYPRCWHQTFTCPDMNQNTKKEGNPLFLWRPKLRLFVLHFCSVICEHFILIRNKVSVASCLAENFPLFTLNNRNHLFSWSFWPT